MGLGSLYILETHTRYFQSSMEAVSKNFHFDAVCT